MLEYSDTEFRFIEFHRIKGYLPLDSQDFFRLYRSVLEKKFRTRKGSNRKYTHEEFFKFEQIELNETIQYLEAALDSEIRTAREIEDYKKIEALGERYDPILHFLYAKRKNSTKHSHSTGKLKWNGGPALLGYFIRTLIDNQYIEQPMKGGTENNSELTRICLNVFDLDTTLNSLRKELSEGRNTLSEKNKKRINIPPLDAVH